MTDEKHYKLVEDFGNEHSIAIGGNIKVTHSCYRTGFEPKDKSVRDAMKYEDVCYLREQIAGADSFVFWLRRKGYDILKRRNK